ncbi:cytochrome P450 [Pseudonocardia sp. MH-G8]|uniref:cytochrome P450 n=1 Tax=Pseudonocardia sp. MH-G8 TaxID=1854588 RepID=UPI000BA04E1F|nr:cytochrome P450 [Pseudonocardia sp. MH-G8]OZM78857.1 cytochrome P450 [Pseudonocardia sp. MH-G8]
MEPTVSYPQTRTCPYRPPHGYSELTAKGPLHRVELIDGKLGWVVTRHAEARALLADPRLSSDRTDPDFPLISARGAAVRRQPPAFIGMDDPEHGYYRRMTIPDFTVKRINELRPRIEEIADGAAEQLRAAGAPADLVANYALPIPSLVICELLGVPYSDHAFFEDASRRLMRSATEEEVAAARKELVQYLDSLVDSFSRDSSQTGLIGRLARGELARGELSRDHLVGTAMLLLTAGHETTANVIALGSVTLLEHPDQLARFRTDPDVVPGVVEELLRFTSVADSAGIRVATADIDIAGERIRAGEGVMIPNGPANFDPEVFPEPDEFDIRRGARKHNAFGYGIHQCLGQNLARLELQIALPLLFERFPTLALARPATELEPGRADTIQGLGELTVTW